MKIESLIKRKNKKTGRSGTEVQLEAPRRVYHFKPESGNHADPHVCEVENEGHIRALLKIREGFRPAAGEDAPPAAEIEERQLNGSTVHDAKYTIKGGDTIELSDLVNMAFDDSGLDEDQWNELDDQQRYEYIDTTLRELQEGFKEEPTSSQQEAKDEEPEQQEEAKQDESKPEEKADAPLDRKELAAQFEKKFGRKPSNRMKAEDIARALSEED